MIDLRCQDVGDMLASLPDGSASFTHFDPPWPYVSGDTGHGAAAKEYGGLPEAAIAAHMALAYRVAAPDTYLAVWCTFPKLSEWMSRPDPARQAGEVTPEFLVRYAHLLTPAQFVYFQDRIRPEIAALSPHETVIAAGWEYVSGAAWGKTNGLGVGYHFRGDSELLLLYRKGTPKPLGGSKSNLWLAPRTGHSEKPQTALRALVQMAAPVGGLVVDCYAGESASLARACRALGRAYVGAELSEARWNRAMIRLSQQEMLTVTQEGAA